MGAGLCHPASTWGFCRAQGVTGGMEALESAQCTGSWVIPISQRPKVSIEGDGIIKSQSWEKSQRSHQMRE